MHKYPDYRRPVYRPSAYGYREFSGYEPRSGKSTAPASTPRTDPDLQLYTEITGRRVTANFTHGAWRNEYAATGQSIAMERMLALVTETTHCDCLDGPEPAPPPILTRSWRPPTGLIVYLAAVCLAFITVILIGTGI